MTALFVYYRLASPQTAGDLPTLLAKVWQHIPEGVLPRLYQRTDTATWMETYHGITDAQAFLFALNSALDRVLGEQKPWGERHLEWFETVQM